MFEKEVVSHSIDAQNRVQAKSNSCYLKQNNLAPFNTEQKILEVLDFFDRDLETHVHSLCLLAIPVPWDTCRIVWHLEEEALSSTRVLLMQLYWLVLAEKWPSYL